jgi:secreted trypsin-like serine protease
VGIECLLKAADDTLFAPVGISSGGVGQADLSGRSLSEADQCGLAGVEFKPAAPVAKVAGGQTAAPGSQPWTASIRVRGSTKTFHWCGAAIIGEHHLLTAAHCLEDFPKDVYVIRVGDWDQGSSLKRTITILKCSVFILVTLLVPNMLNKVQIVGCNN